MAAGDIVPVSGAQFEDTLASASPDVLRAMIREFAQRMMDADVEVACNAGYGEVTPERVNSRNGYRRREWDTRAGTDVRECTLDSAAHVKPEPATGAARPWPPVDAVGVDLQQDRNAVPGTAGHLGRRHPGVQPR